MAMKSSFKNMVLCLLVICLACSALLAAVYAVTKEPIDAAAKAKNEAAIKEVLPPSATVIEEEKEVVLDGITYKYNRAFDEKGESAGYSIDVAPVGFGGPIKIKVGFAKDKTIWNTKVLSHAETPGLGAKCSEPSFADQFKELSPSLKKLAVTKDGGDINAITASTITSRAYVDGVALAVRILDEIDAQADSTAVKSDSTSVETLKTVTE